MEVLGVVSIVTMLVPFCYNQGGSAVVIVIFTILLLSVVAIIIVKMVQSKRKQADGDTESTATKFEMPISQVKSENSSFSENQGQELANLKKQMAQMQKTIDGLKKERDELLAENTSLGERIEALRYGNKKNEIQTEVKNDSPKPEEKTEGSSVTLYAESIVDGYMYKVKATPNEDSVFEMLLRGSSYATFEVYKQAEGRVVANPSYLDGCDKQSLGNSSVKVVRQGEARLDENGKWRVSTKMLVHIE